MFSARLGFMRPDSVPTGGVLWTPNDITSATVLAWFDATDQGDLVIESGLVAQLNDLSGKNTLMRNVYGSQQAIHLPDNQNGCDCLQFDGVDDRYSQSSNANGLSTVGNLSQSFSLGDPYAVFSVQNITAKASNQHYVSLSGNVADPWISSYLEMSYKYGKVRRDQGGTQTHTQPQTSPQGWHMHYHSYLGNSLPDSWTDIVDGGTPNLQTNTRNTNHPIDNIAIGCLLRRNRGAGPIQAFTEMIWNKTLLFDRPLDLSEQQKLEGWSAHQLGITDVLPTDHPYKTSAPEK